jgi:type IV secretory pathway TraG/TraD family ATPase VirD4
MIQYIEQLFLEIFRWYFTLPVAYGLVFLIPALALMLLQYAKQDKSAIPGILSAPFFFVTYLHYNKPEVAIRYIDQWIEHLSVPHGNLKTLPLGIEIIFNYFVGPIQYRLLHQEIIFVIFATYLLLLAFHSWKEYKKTGVVLGDMSIASIINKNQVRPLRSDYNELGSGDLATAEAIAKWTKPSGSSGDTALPVSELRGSGGEIILKSGELIIPKEERNRHVLAVAKTGSGKTSRLILPVLYSDCMDKDRSTIVIDSKPEMWEKLANLTRKYNPEKNILLFNPLDRIRSLSWNILSKIETDTDCKLIANTIVMATDNPSSKADSPFFRNNALSILNAIMVGLLHDPNDVLSMPRIHELVQSGMKPLCDWLEAHPYAFRTSRTFVELARSGSQNADTIMSELSMRLAAWDLTDIRATTAENEIDIEDLVSKPTLFIVEFRESELEMLRPLANVIVIELLRFLTKRAESEKGHCLPRPVGLVIDEFASALGRLPDIHVKLNTLRSRNVSIVGAIQSMAQVKANYGDDADSVLAGFNTKIFMPSLDIQDAEWASKETGQMTIRFQTASTGSNRKIVEFFASKNTSTQEQVQQRAVLTPDEIARPSDNRSTFFFPNTAPFQGHLVPIFKVPAIYSRFTEFKGSPELKLRSAPIEYKEIPTTTTATPTQAATDSGLPPGISNTRGWSDQQILDKLKECKAKLDWDNTTGSARKWWEAFENENQHRVALILRLAEELVNRQATITEFFLAYVYSNTDNIQANLHYLDYTRLKKEEEKRKREATATAQPKDSGPSSKAA